MNGNPVLDKLAEELAKTQLTARLEGCKAMSNGALAVAGAYGALFKIFSDSCRLTGGWLLGLLLVPLLCFSVSGLIFARGYLCAIRRPFEPDFLQATGIGDDPKTDTNKTDTNKTDTNIGNLFRTLKKRMDGYITGGSVFFWTGILLAIAGLGVLASFPKPGP